MAIWLLLLILEVAEIAYCFVILCWLKRAERMCPTKVNFRCGAGFQSAPRHSTAASGRDVLRSRVFGRKPLQDIPIVLRGSVE